jgi:hypothetical protein
MLPLPRSGEGKENVFLRRGSALSELLRIHLLWLVVPGEEVGIGRTREMPNW